MAYTLAYDGITLYTIIGVYEWEQAASRPLVFDLRLESAHPLGLTRALIERQLAGWLAPCRYRLLEALAEHVAQRMLMEWHCSRVVIGIEKPGALGDQARVGIRIVRDAKNASCIMRMNYSSCNANGSTTRSNSVGDLAVCREEFLLHRMTPPRRRSFITSFQSMCRLL
jgi:dihydroneopterin aldolase